MKNKLFAVLLLILFSAVAFQAQQQSELAKFIQENYTKREVMIPMRDGVKLFTAIYEPKDKSQKYPMMFDRTPYTVQPYGADKFKTLLGPSELFTREGYIFVYRTSAGAG